MPSTSARSSRTTDSREQTHCAHANGSSFSWFRDDAGLNKAAFHKHFSPSLAADSVQSARAYIRRPAFISFIILIHFYYYLSSSRLCSGKREENTSSLVRAFSIKPNRPNLIAFVIWKWRVWAFLPSICAATERVECEKKEQKKAEAKSKKSRKNWKTKQIHCNFCCVLFPFVAPWETWMRESGKIPLIRIALKALDWEAGSVRESRRCEWSKCNKASRKIRQSQRRKRVRNSANGSVQR